MPDIFERLNTGQRPPQTKTTAKKRQLYRGTLAGAKTFLMNTLAKGPVPTALIEERGAVYGFNKRQLIRAKRHTGIVAFKEIGKRDGCWFWGLPETKGIAGY